MPTNVEFFTQSYSLATLHAGCKIPSSGGEGQPASRVWSKRHIPITTRRIRSADDPFRPRYLQTHVVFIQSLYPQPAKYFARVDRFWVGGVRL